MQCILYPDRYSRPTWYCWWPFDRWGIDSICQLEMVYVPFLFKATPAHIFRLLHQSPHRCGFCNNSVPGPHTRTSRNQNGHTYDSRDNIKTGHRGLLLVRAVCNHVAHGSAMGWNEICLEQRNCHWSPLRVRRRVYYLCSMGVSTRRQGDDSFFHVAEESCMVVLPGYGFLLRRPPHFLILLTYLLPGREGDFSFL